MCLTLSVSLIPMYADYPCKKAREEALKMFHAGQYYQAKQLFQEVSGECGKNYQNVDAMLELCNSALRKIDTVLLVDNSREEITIRYISPTRSSISFDVLCYGDYTITGYPAWCDIAYKDASSFEVNYSTNSSDTIRLGVIYVEGGKKTIAVILEQEGSEFSVVNTLVEDTVVVEEQEYEPEIEPVAEIEPEPEVVLEPLTLSHSTINASSGGITDYITVSCGKAWEIQYPSGTMYSADRIGDQVRVKILQNKTYSARTDYFYIKTKDDTESIKVYLSQNPAVQPITTTTTTEIIRESAYKKYCVNNGSFEVTWFGTNFSIGTGFEYSISALRLRWGWIQVNPLDLSIGVDFLELMGTSLIYSYQPSINFVIPASENEAIYVGAGAVVGNYIWFKAEAGYRLHWGKNASSDIFVRYDGTVTFGISIQCSSHN